MTVSAVRTAARVATTSTPTLRQGSSGAAVTSLQNKLRAKGYNIAVDGQFGPATKNAVIAFQRANGLSADGVVGPKTWTKLNAAPPPAASSTPTLRQGSSGAAVRTLQTRLRAHGHNVAVDGQFGPGTKNAVLAFQRAKGLSADGVVGPNTWSKLNAAPPSSSPPVAGSPTLKQGANGAAVRDLQTRLRAHGYNVSVDGQFGPGTAGAVRAFQAWKGLGVDGVVGPRTWQALRAAPTGSPPSQGGTTVTGYVNGRPTTITVSSVGNGQTMRSDAAARFNSMKAAAARAGITLHVNSGFRTMAQQRYLYDLYISGRGNLAARPGYSNHQGGVSADINVPGGYGGATYRWLQANARSYGFVNDVGGEPWHWTFRG
ncbi:MAG: peptidase [Archangium gephyra]|uniref:Peptidase n=1 Tax=Archangium gephyra TaxID=48 RepID=A0A2W5VEK1_9BACT|nr:MAG: peptidase [Archangium gephyra]